eukprot:3444588-Pleurochrysis_carterae.AAC.1
MPEREYPRGNVFATSASWEEPKCGIAAASAALFVLCGVLCARAADDGASRGRAGGGLCHVT